MTTEEDRLKELAKKYTAPLRKAFGLEEDENENLAEATHQLELIRKILREKKEKEIT